MEVNWKASVPIVVLFGITAVGLQIANALQHTLGMSTATELVFFFFLVGCIAALKTADIIRRRSPEHAGGTDVNTPTRKHR